MVHFLHPPHYVPETLRKSRKLSKLALILDSDAHSMNEEQAKMIRPEVCSMSSSAAETKNSVIGSVFGEMKGDIL